MMQTDSPRGLHCAKVKKDPRDFSSGLKLPKLESRTRRVKGGSGDYNSKVRAFKDSNSNALFSSNMDAGDDMKSTPKELFQKVMTTQSDLSDGAEDEAPNLKDKVKDLLKQRKRNKVDHEFHSRISKAFDKIEIFEKGVRNFDDSLVLARGRLAEAGRKSEGSSPSPRLGKGGTTAAYTSSVFSELLKLPKSLKQRSKKKQKAAEVAALGTEVLGNPQGPDLLNAKSSHALTNLSLQKKWSTSELEVPEKRTLDPRLLLHKSKGGTDFQDLHDKLEKNNRRAKRQANRSTKRIKNKMESVYTGEGNLTRLMSYDPNQGPTKAFTEFLQTTGGATGGWDKEDHDIFLGVFLKWKHRPAEVMRLVSKECPGRQLNEIAAHLEWYERYEVLNVANKAYVRQWKIDKRKEREQMFKMAKEDAKAKIESEKSRYEMLKANREAEREREKTVLNQWKKSKKPEIKKLEIENDMLRDPDGPARTTKLGQHLQMTKDRLVKLLPPTHQVRQVLTKNRVSLARRREGTANEGTVEVVAVASSPKSTAEIEPKFLTSPSSGVFDELLNETEKNSSLATGSMTPKNQSPGGKFDKIDCVDPDSIDMIPMPKQTASEKRLAFYQSRDETMMVAKRNAIQLIENQRNKGFLSSEEIKKRISKITLPSQVSRLTKGVELRQSIRQMEAMEASARQELKKCQKELHRHSRVPTPQMFKTGSMVNSIPKLGKPAWRARNA